MRPRPERCGVRVRPATPADIEHTARLHRQHLPHGLFPLLGQAFMGRWHATFLDAPGGIVLVAVRTVGDSEHLVGFLVGSVDQVKLVDHVLRHHRWRLGASGAWSLLARPRLALHFLRTRAPAYARRLTRRPVAGHRSGVPPEAEPQTRQPGGRADAIAVVTALVVVPEARGARVGAALVAGFLDRARAAGAPEARLTTLAGADGAGRFYEGLGWRRRDVHPTRDGVLVATYDLALDRGDAPEPASPHAVDRTPENGAPLRDQQTS